MILIFNEILVNHKSPTSHLSSLFATDISYISFTLCMYVQGVNGKCGNLLTSIKKGHIYIIYNYILTEIFK